MILGSTQFEPPGPGASSFDAFSYVGMMVVGSLSLLLLFGLNIAAVWWLIRRATARATPAPQHNEDGAGWAEHANRVVASERDLARLRADHPDLPAV